MDEKKTGYNGFTEARARANKKYMEKFCEVKVRMTPERREEIKAYAASKGMSATEFINQAILEAMNK